MTERQRRERSQGTRFAFGAIVWVLCVALFAFPSNALAQSKRGGVSVLGGLLLGAAAAGLVMGVGFTLNANSVKQTIDAYGTPKGAEVMSVATLSRRFDQHTTAAIVAFVAAGVAATVGIVCIALDTPEAVAPVSFWAAPLQSGGLLGLTVPL